MEQHDFLKISEDGKTIIKCDVKATGHIDIPVGITLVCADAFDSCVGIESISIPNTIVCIGENAFSGCVNIEEVYITDIEAWLNIIFDRSSYSWPQGRSNPLCYAERLILNGEIVRDLVIPEGVKEIRDYAFYCYKGLYSVVFPKSLTSVGEGAFQGCNIDSVFLYDNLNFVGNHAFHHCENLKTVCFSDGVSYIGNYAFYGCSSLNSINLPQSTIEIGTSAFEECEKLKSVNIPGIQSIGDSCFKGCRVLSDIEFPPSLTYIGRECFYDTALSYVKIPKNVRDIYSFANMNIYIDVELGNEYYKSVNGSLYATRVDNQVLIKYFGSSPNVKIEGIHYISDEAFGGCKMLKTIAIIGPVKSIGSAFCGCDNLEEVVLPDGITRLDGFEGCGKLSKIVIPESVAVIENGAFRNCSSLKEIVMPSNLTKIGDNAFYGCENLQKIVVPDIDKWCAVENRCNPLTIAQHIYDKDENEITALHISNIVKIIKSQAFKGCVAIESVFLPESVVSVEFWAFEGCKGLKSVTIESQNVVEILSRFEGCDNIETISIKHFNESFCFGLRCFKKLKTIYSIDNAGNRVIIDVPKIMLSKAQELKMMSFYYHNLGMNLTQISGEFFDRFFSFKAPLEIKGMTLDDLYNTKQDTAVLLKQDWMHASGLGLVLGWEDYRALDFDYVESKDINVTVNNCLKKLGLPEDYQWIVRSGSNEGFHIILRVKDFCKKDSSPNALAFITHDKKRIELRWKGHLVLPPSIHYSGNIYSFYRNQIPNTIPQYIELGKIEQLIEDFCGENYIKSLNWNKINFKIIEKRNNNTEESESGKVVFNSLNENILDHIKWYESCGTSQTYNLLAIQYLCGEEVSANKQKAYELFLKADNDQAYFNLASLISIGYLEGTIEDVENYLGKIDYNKLNDVFEEIEEDVEQIRMNAKKYIKIAEKKYILFFDTETTGVPFNYNAPSSDTINWPRLVQLAWIITDEECKKIHTGNLIIKPDGFVIPDDAAKLHGITTQRAKEEGVSLSEAIEQFKVALDMATYLVGHNVEFDKKIVGAEMIRLGQKDELCEKKSYCTMLSSVDFCKIPGNFGYKYPKLQELYKKLFGKEFEDAHNALSDIEATEKCFWELRKRKLI